MILSKCLLRAEKNQPLSLTFVKAICLYTKQKQKWKMQRKTLQKNYF